MKSLTRSLLLKFSVNPDYHPLTGNCRQLLQVNFDIGGNPSSLTIALTRGRSTITPARTRRAETPEFGIKIESVEIGSGENVVRWNLFVGLGRPSQH